MLRAAVLLALLVAASTASGQAYYGVPATTYPTAVTAKAGGGQSGATPLQYGWNFATGATAADSLLLPPAVSGLEVRVYNGSSVSLAVFPQSGERAGPSLAFNASINVGSIGNTIFYCLVNGTWLSK